MSSVLRSISQMLGFMIQSPTCNTNPDLQPYKHGDVNALTGLPWHLEHAVAIKQLLTYEQVRTKEREIVMLHGTLTLYLQFRTSLDLGRELCTANLRLGKAKAPKAETTFS